jgi:cell shape-determining protein MreC
MPYNHGQSEFASERKAVVIAIILFLNLILISSQIILKSRQSLLANIIANSANPFQIAFQKSSDFVVHEFQHYVFLKNVFKRYQILKQKYTEAKYQNYLLKSDLRRLQAIRQVQERGKTDDFVLVNCISVDPNFPFHSVIVDRGSRSGIKENMTALNLEGELVGRTVSPVSPFSATVRLITSSVGGAGAYIETNLLEGFLSGHDDSLCSFKYLITNKPVHKGDLVITSGTDLIFRPYIPVGRVVEMEKDVLTPKIWVKPFFVERSIKQLVLLR